MIPHASTILEGVGPTLQGAIKMTMDLMLPFTALIHQSELEQSPNVRTFTSQCNEHRHVHRTILHVFTVGVKVNSPIVTAYGEGVAGDVLSRSHPFRERVAADREVVGPIHRLVDRFGRGGVGIGAASNHLENPRNEMK